MSKYSNKDPGYRNQCLQDDAYDLGMAWSMDDTFGIEKYDDDELTFMISIALANQWITLIMIVKNLRNKPNE